MELRPGTCLQELIAAGKPTGWQVDEMELERHLVALESFLQPALAARLEQLDSRESGSRAIVEHADRVTGSTARQPSIDRVERAADDVAGGCRAPLAGKPEVAADVEQLMQRLAVGDVVRGIWVPGVRSSRAGPNGRKDLLRRRRASGHPKAVEA